MKNLAAILLIASSTATEPYVVPASMADGGNVQRFINRVVKLDKARRQVRIEMATCSSACTLFLIARDVCISSRTLTGWHGPQTPAAALSMLPVSGYSPEITAQIVRYMELRYDRRWPGLGKWYRNVASKRPSTLSMIYVTGAELNRVFGVPICEEKE